MTSNRYAIFFICLICSISTQVSAAEIKNVLFIVSDDLKASVLGCYGDQICKTPYIDKLAREGVVFEQAYCQATWCAPSRQSFMFSRYTGRGDKGHPSMTEHFKNHGYYSGRIGKIYHMRVPGDIIDGTDGPDHAASWTEKFNCQGQEAHTPGLYALLNKNIFTRAPENRQSTRDPHRMFVSVEQDGDGSDQPDYKAADKTIELLKKHHETPESEKRPFFLAVGFVRPHYPSVAPKKYFDMYPIDQITLPKQVENDHADIPKAGLAKTLTHQCGIGAFPDNQKRMWAAYYATVTFMDEQLGRIMTELDRLGLRDSTAVVFTSDHGYHLGEHEFWQKSNLHEEVNRIPLIISMPGTQPGRSTSLAELTDIYPTMSQAAGLAIPQNVEGLSLLPVLKDHDHDVREYAYTLNKGSFALRNKTWAYIKYKKDGEELYNMKKDPGQFTNQANNPEYTKIIKAFRNELKRRQAK